MGSTGEQAAEPPAFRDTSAGMWSLRESVPGPAEYTTEHATEHTTEHTVLLLAGALCSARCYDTLVGHPTFSASSVRVVAATLPGFGRTPAPEDVSVPRYGELTAELAQQLGAAAVVGHSLGANVAAQLVLSGGYSGPAVLIAPSLSRRDESIFPRALDRLATVLGHLPYSLMMKIIGPAMKGSLPSEQADLVVSELGNNDPRFVRRQTRAYLEYLDQKGSLAPDLAASKSRVVVVFGENDDIKLQPEERAALQASSSVALREIAGAGHFSLIEEPGQIADIILEAMSVGTA